MSSKGTRPPASGTRGGRRSRARQPIMKTDRMLRLERMLLNQVHDGRRKGDKKSCVSEKHQRCMNIDPVAANPRRNPRRRAVKQVRNESHQEDQRKRKHAERRDSIACVGDQETQSRQGPKKRKPFV